MRIFFLICSCLLSVVVYSQTITIKNGAVWTDNNGNDLQAHGSDIIQVGDTWYIIGEDRVEGGVNMYSSKNLVDWKFENKIISKNTCPQLMDGSRFIERPHLLYNKLTKKYVVWLHWEGANYAPAEAGVFYCDKINGDYIFHKGFRPFNNMSRDDNVFLDDDGKAYFVSAANHNADLKIYELTPDFLDVKSEVATLWVGQYREAPVIMKKDNIYYLFSSGCTGWDPNQGQYAYSNSIKGPWSNRINIGNKKTYDTQPTCIFKINGTKQTTYVYCGDRWQDPSLSESKTILLPLRFNGTQVYLDYYDSWDLNLETGEWNRTVSKNRLSKAKWKLKNVSSQEGNSAILAFDNNINTIWHSKYSGGVDKMPHELVLDLGEESAFSGLLCTPRQDKDINGAIRNFLFFASNDPENWGMPVAGGWMTWQSEISFPEVRARYIKLVVYSEFDGNSYASLAELDLLTDTKYKESDITPYMKINEGNWNESTNIDVRLGNSLYFGPQSSDKGSWVIYTPDGDALFSRSPTVDINSFDCSGTYMIMLLNQYNCVSQKKIEVNVLDNREIYISKLTAVIDKAKSVYNRNLSGSYELYSVMLEANRMKLNLSATFEQLSAMTLKLSDAIVKYIDINIQQSENMTHLLKVYDDFSSKKPEGWSGTVLTNAQYGCGEFYNNNMFSFYQSFDNLAPGYYLFGVQAFYRDGNNDGGMNYELGRENLEAKLFFGNKSHSIESLYALPYESDNNYNGYCNDMKSASEMFAADKNNYANWLLVNVENDTYTLGIRKSKEKSNDWCCFNNFSLYYLGENPTSIKDNIQTDKKVSTAVYNLNGIYVGDITDESLSLPAGIYICNGKKLLIK